MRVLYYFWLSPSCRKVMIVLGEKKLAFDAILERHWERRHEFLALNPAGEVPVLQEDDRPPIAHAQTICEYLDEIHDQPALLGTDAEARAEARRLSAWFDEKFHAEVTGYLLSEKVLKRFTDSAPPEAHRIRAALRNIDHHLDYVSWLAERRNWLAGEDFSLADISAAAQLSAVDYLGDVPWERHPAAKDWYARVKSRPSFRPVLAEHMPGLPPPKHYADLDF